ncbi:glycosyltransferase [Actinospongicola halichondriae]|uniref:glycosyltransferase n=1 Tax=Actinospongicola halichondriae TaxID=3236844 RepID=UPI003D4F4BB4
MTDSPETQDIPGRVSIVITNRDYGRFLRAAVDSALAQDDVEVIVVDDGSTDDSLATLADYGRMITVVELDGQGQAAAMNAGFAVTTGDLVVFLDADDVLAPGAVPRARPCFSDLAVARVHAPLRRVDVHGAPIGGTVPPVISVLPHGDLRRAVVHHPDDLAWQPTSGNVYRRAALAGIFPLPEAEYRISADHLLNALTALVGRVGRVLEIGGDYRIHGDNADARSAFDLERVQGIVARSQVTHRHIAALAASLGLSDDAATGVSVSFAGNRLVSLRLGRATHPIAGDRRRTAWRDGIRAARGRSDLGVARRVAAAGFITALALAPRASVAPLAHRFLTGSTDGGPPLSTSGTR